VRGERACCPAKRKGENLERGGGGNALGKGKKVEAGTHERRRVPSSSIFDENEREMKRHSLQRGGGAIVCCQVKKGRGGRSPTIKENKSVQWEGRARLSGTFWSILKRGSGEKRRKEELLS